MDDSPRNAAKATHTHLVAVRNVFSGNVRENWRLRGQAIMELGNILRGCEPAQHEVDRTDLYHRLTRVGASFVVLTMASVAAVPTERAFGDPTLGDQHETFGIGRTRDNFQIPLRPLAGQPSS